ncbi:MAG: hypothetical protein ACP5HJ_01685, partial [Candidatus Micrarchaeia archaeon]
PEAIFERLVNHLKELKIENIYLLTDSEDEQERFSKYIKKKNWEGVYCFYIKEQGTGNTLLSFKEENKDKLKENFLIIAGDSIFEKKEEEVKEVFKNFIEEGKKLIQNKNARIVRGIIQLENYKGGKESLINQTKCKIDKNNIVISARKKCEPEKNEKLFTSLILVTPEIFQLLDDFKEKNNEFDIHDLRFTKFLIEKGVLYASTLNIYYFNINTPEDLSNYYIFEKKESIGEELKKSIREDSQTKEKDKLK